jgi:hypothetical protein
VALNRIFLLCIAGLFSLTVSGQQPDSLVRAEMERARADSAQRYSGRNPLPLKKRSTAVQSWTTEEGVPLKWQLQSHQPFFGFNGRPLVSQSRERKVDDRDMLFYVLTGMVLLFALLKQLFGKYLADLRRLFFRSTLKQRQLREQLLQTPLPSLLFNIFFFLTGGLYVAFLLTHLELDLPDTGFWLLALYAFGALLATYLIKYIGLKVIGWLFRMSQLTDAYIFVVFMVNKVLGIFLLPFLWLVSYASGELQTVAWIISWIGIGLLLLYRYILGWVAVRNQVSFRLFHFILYLAAFEVVPLLLIYKVVLSVFK